MRILRIFNKLMREGKLPEEERGLFLVGRETGTNLYRLSARNDEEDQETPFQESCCGRFWRGTPEMQNSKRSEAIKAGQARARVAGKHMGRPRKVRRRHEVGELRKAGRSWSQTATLGISARTARRIYEALPEASGAGGKYGG